MCMHWTGGMKIEIVKASLSLYSFPFRIHIYPDHPNI